MFGEDIDVSEITPLGKYIRINTYDQAEQAEDSEMVYNSINPLTAVGVALDNLCVFVNISRNPATPAHFKVRLNAANTVISDGTIPIGFLVGTDTGLEYYTTESVTLTEGGSCETIVECTTKGIIGNVDYRAINVIVNPDARIASIEGLELVQAGEDAESDVDLRKRFMAAREGLGSCNTSAIQVALMKIQGVNDAIVIENEEDFADADGRPPHSFECYVSGGELQYEEIANAIYEKKPVGIKSHGTVAATAKDIGGHEHIIRFSPIQAINVDMQIKIKIDETFNSATGYDDIRNNLIDHVLGIGIGKPVVYSALYGQIHKVTGVVEVVELLLSTDGTNFASGNVNIEKYESAKCGVIDIEVIAN